MNDYLQFVSPEYRHTMVEFLETYGEPIGIGRNRMVFRSDEWVIKVPMNEAGFWDNRHEACLSGPHYPRTEMACHDRAILRMEFVTHRGASEKPDWTWGVDCGQVGYTSDGRLVAYDYRLD